MLSLYIWSKKFFETTSSRELKLTKVGVFATIKFVVDSIKLIKFDKIKEILKYLLLRFLYIHRKVRTRKDIGEKKLLRA